MAATGAALVAPAQVAPPAPLRKPPSIAVDEQRGELFVQGTVFRTDDAAAALQAEALLDGPGTGLPTEGNWVPLDVGAFREYLRSIREPSLGRLARKSFGRGVDQLQALGGRALQLAGAEQLGGRIVARQEEQLARTQPFERLFTDVDSGRGAVEWFVANLAQQGPNLLSSVLAAGAGFLAGKAVGGPLGSAGGALAGLMGRTTFKRKVLDAAAKRAAGGTLNAAENKVLREAAGIAGAVALATAQNYGMGAAEHYGELREQGVGADEAGARLAALAAGVPHAVLGTLPEFVLAARVFGGVLGPAALPAGARLPRRGAELLRRGAVGFGVGGALGGTTEAAQEALLLGVSGQDLTGPEGANRLINAFAAGFGIGGPIGAVANLRSRTPQNLLNPAQSAEPRRIAPSGPPGTQGALNLGPVPAAPAAAAPPISRLVGPAEADSLATAPLTPAADPHSRQGAFPFAATQGVLDVFGQDMPVQEHLARMQPVAAPQEPGPTAPPIVTDPRQGVFPFAATQGVLDVFGGDLPAQEQLARIQPPVAPPVAPELLTQPVVHDPRQGALQFAPPVPPVPPPANAAMAEQLQRWGRHREFQAAQAQVAAQRVAEVESLARASQHARDLYTMRYPSTALPPVEDMPMQPVQPIPPAQLPLFTRRQAPRPPRAEALRRGVNLRRRPVPLTATPDAAAEAAPVQLALFNRQGRPTLPALRAAGVKTRLPPAPVVTPRVRPGGKRGLLRQAGVAEINILPQEAPRAVQKRSPAQVPARPALETRARVGGEVPARQQPAPARETPKAEALKARRPAVPPKQAVVVAPRLAKAEEMAQAERQWPEYADTARQPMWGDLTDAQREQWRKVAVEDGRPTIAATEVIAPAEPDLPVTPPQADREPTQLEVLEEDIATASAATNMRTFREAIQTVIHYAFFAGESTPVRKLADRARDYLSNTQFSDSQHAAMDTAFLDAVQYESHLEALYKGGANQGKPKPWFSYALSRGLLRRMNPATRITNMPEEYRVAPASPAEAAPTPPPQQGAARSAEDIGSAPESLLAELINDMVTRIRQYSRLDAETVFHRTKYPNVQELAATLYKRLDPAGKEFTVRGHKLREYFNADGTPRLFKSGRHYLFTTEEVTPEVQRRLERERQEAVRARAAAERERTRLEEAERERARLEREGFRDEAAWDDPEGMYYRDDGTPIPAPLSAGRVRLLVNAFLGRLQVKPTVSIYADVADLKARNPELYRRARTARKEGDFDTTNAAGYSFGPHVLIFTKFIRTEQQLRFILAHETLGHFGFRAVMPKGQLDETLRRIYATNPDIQAAVDAKIANHGMSRLEATEEYLADNAASLDSSILARFWLALKNFLNRLGFEFQDDEARYFLSLARNYVRRGGGGNFVSARGIAQRMEALRQDQVEGRYAREFAGNMGSSLFAVGSVNRRYGATGGLLGASEFFAKRAFGVRKDVPGVVGRLMEHLQTLDNKSRRSYGLNQVYRLLERQQQHARALLSKYQRMTQFTHSPTVFGFGDGVTEAQKQVAGELLARAALLRTVAATDDAIRKYGPLVLVDEMGNVTVDAVVRKQIEDAGFVTAQEFRDGFDIRYTDGSTARFQYNVDENSPEWRVYTELRTTVNDAAVDMMLANYEAAQAETSRVLGGLNTARSGTNVFTDIDLAALRRASVIYRDKRYAGSGVVSAGVELKRAADKDSEDFLIAFGRALFNDDVFAAWMKDPNAKAEVVKDMQEFQAAEYDDLRAQLPSLRDKVKGDKQSFRIQKAIRDLFLFDLQSRNAEYYAKRTILGSYVPFTRRGSEQVRLVATDARGNHVELDETVRSALPYFQTNTRQEALEIAEALDREFGDLGGFEVLNANGDRVTVRFHSEVSRVRQSPDLTEAVNFNEFVYVLNRLDINIDPMARERIITILTAQNARARHNLQRSGTEGWDKDVVRSVSEHLETNAHVAAKKLFRHRLDDLLLDNDNWFGSDATLAGLSSAVKAARTDGERARAQRAYDEYAYMYRYMKGSAGQNTVVIDGKRVPTLGRGEDYKEEAKQVLRWYSETTNITDSTEDMLSGEAGSALKLATVVMQLGGSVATAVINLASLVSHSIPYLSFYNPSRGFGGGYGWPKAMAALWQAARNVKNPRLAEAADLAKILERGTYRRYGLTEDEARFLFEQTERGTLQAAQFNALIGTARGKVFNNKAQTAIQTWMWMFSYTEQFNRRTTALAAYRLEKDRLRAQGVTDEQQIIQEATETARVAVYSSQGEYAMFNRPEMARGNILQYIFMYKQFVIITVQLLRNLPPAGQALMLSFLLIASGLRGLPFAADIFDIVDTIAQKLGLKTASVEKALVEWIDSVAPGMSLPVMRGVLDRWTGATFSTRLGMGDLFPLTGAAKAGADPAREAANFAGPVFSALEGLVGMAGGFAKYGAEAIGLRPDVTSISGIMRESPIAAARALFDGMAYLDSGTITNTRGQVVAREAPTLVTLARFMGFYPAIATQQNDIVRLSKAVTSYGKAIKADFTSAYVKARLANDAERMREIVTMVQEWNEDAAGTGLEIRGFVRSATRAAIEASRPTALRYLRTTPRQMRPETVELLNLYGLMDEIH